VHLERRSVSLRPVPSIEIKKTCAPNQERLYCYQKGKGKNVHVFCTSSSSDE